MQGSKRSDETGLLRRLSHRFRCKYAHLCENLHKPWVKGRGHYFAVRLGKRLGQKWLALVRLFLPIQKWPAEFIGMFVASF